MKIYWSFLFLMYCFAGMSQSIVGKWKTVDDKTGEQKSVVKIFEKKGIYYGKVVHILKESMRDQKCSKCEGVNKDKAVLGMTIIYGLKKSGNEFDHGNVLDPESGVIYDCHIKMLGDDKLEIRGYVGFSFFGRSQTWMRTQ